MNRISQLFTRADDQETALVAVKSELADVSANVELLQTENERLTERCQALETKVTAAETAKATATAAATAAAEATTAAEAATALAEAEAAKAKADIQPAATALAASQGAVAPLATDTKAGSTTNDTATQYAALKADPVARAEFRRNLRKNAAA